MNDQELTTLIAAIELKGWRFWVDIDEYRRTVYMEMTVQPSDNRNPGQLLSGFFGDSFVVPEDWLSEAVLNRVFCNIQYLTDHELREQFTVDGVRMFEAHGDHPVTGLQKDWFVEYQSALRGY